MTTISIIGTGNMGTAIGALLRDGGSDVTTVGRDQVGVAPLGDIVILAVPYPAVAGIVDAYREQLGDRIVVDITNPINFETFAPAVAAGTSAADELQKQLPSARVLKAFNTNFAATLAAKKIGDQQTTVLIAGDDASAKQLLADALSAGGVQTADAGPLARAVQLEAIGFLAITLAVSEQIQWTGGFALIK